MSLPKLRPAPAASVLRQDSAPTITSNVLPKEINPGHVTDLLRAAGVLHDGRVCRLLAESDRSTILSRIVRLRLSFDRETDAPKTLLLKTAHPDRAQAAAKREVAFYLEVAAAMDGPLVVPRCFDACVGSEGSDWWILLEDLGDTHLIATEWPLPPTLTQCEAMIAARARFHAGWWDDPRLGVSIGTRPSGEDTMRHLERLARAFGRLVNRLGDSIPPELPGLFERMLAETPRLLKQHHAGCKLTIIQGDAHVWNCFVPRDAASNDVRLFDWDCWRIGPGTDDLAYMIAVHWYPDLRRARERRLLDYYHRVLAANGVAGYARQTLDLDYRFSVLWQLATPIWQAAHGIPPVIWWNNLERVLLAIADLGCRDLLR